VTSAPLPRCGVLLAGGNSERFEGGHKGLAPLGSHRLGDYALRALTAVCDEVLVAANDPDAITWFPLHRTVADLLPGLGGLGGLETALRAANGRLLVVCAWDMPMVTAAVLRELISAVDDGASCAVPQGADGRLEPLCAVYGPQCHAAAVSLLETGERRAQALVAATDGCVMTIGSTRAAADDAHTFFNVNTRHDLQIAERWMTNPETLRC